MPHTRSSALALVYDGPGFAYIVDAGGRLTNVGGADWESFALENLAPHLADPGALIGRPLEAFITGDSSQRVLQRTLEALFERRVHHVAYLALARASGSHQPVVGCRRVTT